MGYMYQLNQIPSKAQIKKYIRRIVFGKNIFCPECRSQKVVCYENRYRYKSCRLRFSLVSHTWLKDIKIPLQKFWVILWCWIAQVPVKQSMKLCGLSEEAVRHWFDLFRMNLPENQDILEKIVQLDEAYFKRRAVMIAKQKGTKKLAFEVLNTTNVQRHHADYFLRQHVKPKSRLHTDGAAIYRTADQWWPVKHRWDIHRRWEFELTSEIEGVFGNLRTFIRRMYHHTTPEKLPGIVREFCFRFSLPETFNSPLNYLQKSLSLVPID